MPGASGQLVVGMLCVTVVLARFGDKEGKNIQLRDDRAIDAQIKAALGAELAHLPTTLGAKDLHDMLLALREESCAVNGHLTYENKMCCDLYVMHPTMEIGRTWGDLAAPQKEMWSTKRCDSIAASLRKARAHYHRQYFAHTERPVVAAEDFELVAKLKEQKASLQGTTGERAVGQPIEPGLQAELNVLVIGNEYVQQFPLLGYGGIEAHVEAVASGLQQIAAMPGSGIRFRVLVPKITEQRRKYPFEIIEIAVPAGHAGAREAIRDTAKRIIPTLTPRLDIIWSQSYWSARLLHDMGIPMIVSKGGH